MEGADRPTDSSPTGALEAPIGRMATAGRVVPGWLLLAVALFMVVLLFLPRANIILTDWSFTTTPCNEATETSVVTATFTLRNSGNLEGLLYVQLWVDGSWRAEKPLRVPAGQSLQGQIV